MQIIHASFLTLMMKFYTESISDVIFSIAIIECFSFLTNDNNFICFECLKDTYATEHKSSQYFLLMQIIYTLCILFFNFQDEILLKINN